MIRSARLAGAVGWPSATQNRYRAAGLWTGQTLSAWFAERAALFAEQTAVVDGGRRVSYRELLEAVARLAGGLAATGVREQDRVIVQLPNSLELVEALLALSWLGAIPVLALPAHRRAELSAFTKHAGASALVVAARHAGTDMLEVARAVHAEHPQIERVIVQGTGGTVPTPFHALAALRAHTAVQPNATPKGHDVALLQLSGGSTGIPKLIARTHDDYLYSVRESARLCELSTATRFLAALPMTHNFTLSSPGTLGVFHAGGTVVACANPHPEVALRLLVEERITLVASVPSLARAWLEAKPRYLGALALPGLTLQVGGARLDVQLARDLLAGFGGRLQQVFGMAEGLVNYTRLSDSDDVVCQTQGRPLSEYDELRIVSLEDPEGPAVAPGELGELQTRGPYTICGYFDNPAADAHAFTRDGFYRTGDVVRLTASGNLSVKGRIGDRILRAGEKIAPQEIEAELQQHEGVREVAVVGLPDPLLGEKIHAFVILTDAAQPLSTAHGRAFLRGRGLAEFKLPDAVHVVTELPRTKVGKTDRAALRASHVSS